MFYRATLKQEGDAWLVEFRDCPGCQTFGATRDEVLACAAEALTGWLETHLGLGRVPPRPVAKRGVPVHIGPRLAAALSIRWAREALGLSQTELAKRAGVSQQQVAKLEDPDGNPTIVSLDKIARALGQRLELGLVSDAP